MVKLTLSEMIVDELVCFLKILPYILSLFLMYLRSLASQRAGLLAWRILITSYSIAQNHFTLVIIFKCEIILFLIYL